ncbi:MAG: hypothetical protein VKI82_02190 [Leptolyngbya sp.]|nr:hypothetical protein [Leptolyngbya sp.]
MHPFAKQCTKTQIRRVHNAKARLAPTRSNAEQCTKPIHKKTAMNGVVMAEGWCIQP